MRSFLASVGLILSLCSGALSESKAAINAFKRVESFQPELQERDFDFAYPRRLEKRASPYLTNATQSEYFLSIEGDMFTDLGIRICRRWYCYTRRRL